MARKRLARAPAETPVGTAGLESSSDRRPPAPTKRITAARLPDGGMPGLDEEIVEVESEKARIQWDDRYWNRIE